MQYFSNKFSNIAKRLGWGQEYWIQLLFNFTPVSVRQV